MIPKRFIRLWLGTKRIPARHEEWWNDFKAMHPSWEFVTITDADVETYLPPSLRKIYFWGTDSEAGRSDVLRLGVLHDLGGIYIDTDTMPIRPYDSLLEDPSPFAGWQSKNQLQNAVIATPPEHPAAKALIDQLPDFYEENKDKSPVYATGPRFLTHVWTARDDVRLVPKDYFYPVERIAMSEFILRANANPHAFSAHYVTGSWWKSTGRKTRGGERNG